MCANSIRREVHDLLLRVAEKVAEGCEDELRSLLWLELLAYKREALRELEAPPCVRTQSRESPTHGPQAFGGSSAGAAARALRKAASGVRLEASHLDAEARKCVLQELGLARLTPTL